MRISSATNYDYIALNASIRNLYNNTCQAEVENIRNRFKKYGDEEKRIASYKKAKGCGSVLKTTVARIDNIKFNTCTCSINHPLTDKLLRLSEILDKGILPFSGSTMEQPAQIMELLDIAEHAKIRELNLRKEKANG